MVTLELTQAAPGCSWPGMLNSGAHPTWNSGAYLLRNAGIQTLEGHPRMPSGCRLLLHAVAAPGCLWLLQAAPGRFWLLLATPGCFWVP